MINQFLARFKKDTYIVWSSQIINALLSVILGKIIATFYSSSDFGQFTLITSLLFLYTSVFINPLQQFFSVQLGSSDRRPLLTTFVWGMSAVNFIFFLFPLIASFFLPNVTNTHRFFLFMLCLGQSWASLLTNYFNIEKKFILNGLVILLPSLLNITFVVLLLTQGFANVTYLIFSISLANLITPITLFTLLNVKGIKKTTFRYAIKRIESFLIYLPKAYGFSLPLIFLAIFSWLATYSDRYIINILMQPSDVGIYSANYGLASKVMLLSVGPLLTLLRPDIYGEYLSLIDKKILLKKTLLRYFALGLFIVLIFVFFYNQIGLFFLSKEYQAGFFILVPISLTYLILTSSQFFDLFFYANSKTGNILLINGVGMLINLILNIFYSKVPSLGGMCF